MAFARHTRKSKLVQRRRYTCPSAQDISRALQNPGSAPSAGAVSLDELIQRCLNCFDSEGKLSSPKGSQLVHMTLMMHSWVVPSQMFAHKLLTLYPQLSHSRTIKSLWSFPCGHMTVFFNLLRKQAWHCFTLDVQKQI
ncbi:unnamed protein product [Tetraodon nigroviridis]|uniref:(spotted green pufferfish) hypothetical protein n=1 Tax=Tetraodon nigroviridis TaxID=99883 RepID=Q4RFS3_TETNG|nr:unnamed protein product [Tetraodon nigroviridis]